MLTNVSIFFDTAYHTYIRQIRASDYIQTLNGNWLTTRYIDPAYYDELKNDDSVSYFESEIVMLNDEETIHIIQIKADASKLEQWFSLETRMPIKYHSEHGSGDNYIAISFELYSFDDLYIIDDDTFNTDLIH